MKVKIRRAIAICGLVAIVLPLQFVAQYTRCKLIDIGIAPLPSSVQSAGIDFGIDYHSSR